MAVWGRGMGYMADNPILGVGANAFPIAEGMISEISERQRYGIGLKWSAAHNSFVQIGAELGVPGLLAFVFLLYSGITAAWRVGRRHPGVDRTVKSLGQAVVGAFVGFTVSGFFLSHGYSVFLYAMLGTTVGLAHVDQLSKRALWATRRTWPTAAPSMAGPGRPGPESPSVA